MKIDSEHTSESKLQVFEASCGTSSVRLAMDGFGSGVLTVFDRKQKIEFRIDLFAIACLENVTSKYMKKEFKEQTNETIRP
jgi:hypothetical protein